MEVMLRSTNITEDECKGYNSVIDKFDQFFKVRKMSFSNGLSSIGDVKKTLNLQSSSSPASTICLKIVIMVNSRTK